MIIHSPAPSLHRPNLVTIANTGSSRRSFVVNRAAVVRLSATVGAIAAAAVVMSPVAFAVEHPPPDAETLSNVPQTLSGDCGSEGKECKKPRIQRPKSRKAESCTVKCVNTCIRGGNGAPGEGPLNIRSLVECSDICNLIGDGDYGP